MMAKELSDHVPEGKELNQILEDKETINTYIQESQKSIKQ